MKGFLHQDLDTCVSEGMGPELALKNPTLASMSYHAVLSKPPPGILYK